MANGTIQLIQLFAGKDTYCYGVISVYHSQLKKLEFSQLLLVSPECTEQYYPFKR